MAISINTFSTLLIISSLLTATNAFGASGVKARSFVYTQDTNRDKPKLILIGGGPGTGKSTFGMSVALDQGILKCVSTDTVRAVMRSYVPHGICPALHRSSYQSTDDGDDPVKSWKETCDVLESSVEGLVDDAINRGTGLVLEGVSIKPSNKWIKKWEDAGGVAIGCMLTVPDEDVHKSLLLKRGFITGKGNPEAKKLKSFDRVRLIQAEMVRLAVESNWLLIEQKVEPDPLDMVAGRLRDSKAIDINLSKPETEMIDNFSKSGKTATAQK